MAQLTKEQIDFLKSQGVPLSKVFDATGMGLSKYGAAMKELGMVVAYGVTPCKKAGHRLKTRSGHCVQCKTANLAFQARFDDPGEVYVALSAKQNILKVGTSTDRYTRVERINAYGYGGASDWVIRFHKQYPKAGRVEYEAHTVLDSFRVARTYNKDGFMVECRELFQCDLSTAIAAVEQAAAVVLR